MKLCDESLCSEREHLSESLSDFRARKSELLSNMFRGTARARWVKTPKAPETAIVAAGYRLSWLS